MAKKRRTPPPPRVQAPQRRDGRRAADRRTRQLLYGAAALGLIALAVVLGVIFLTGNDNSSGSTGENQTLAAGCTLQRFPLLGRGHVSSESAKMKWNSWPPTSGAHYGIPAPFNFYDTAINPRITLHNLEHGGIVIFYGNRVPASQISALRSFWQDDPNAILVAPMPTLDKNITVPKPVPNYANKIVATAWTANTYDNLDDAKGNGFRLTCPRFDEDTFAEFRDIHRGKGPEKFPVSALTPGS